MIDFLSSTGAAVGWSVVWQGTLALAAGLFATALCARRPARADALLVAGIAAALVAPIGTFAVHQLGWGMLMPGPAPTASVSAIGADEGEARVAPRNEAPASASTSFKQISETPDQVDAPDLSSFAPPKDVLSRSERRQTAPPSSTWITFLLPALFMVWLALSAAALARLGGAVWSGRKLLAASYPTSDPRIGHALALAADRLRLDVPIEPRVSASVRCPVIWCWSRLPIVLLPVEFAAVTDEAARLGIFCHELAHWKRRDHLSSLAADVLCCAVPWQPLAWWAARRHAQLSELACDEWVLASGQSAESYADSLLDLIPQRGAPLALAVLRNRGGLAGRIGHILRTIHARPSLGRRWLAAVASSTLVLVALVALAQQKPLTASDQPAAQDSQPPSDRQQVSGVVLDLSERPVAGARVIWVAQVQRGNHLPHDDPRGDRIDSFAQTTTDDDGRFTMSANFNPRVYSFPSIVVRHDGHGLGLRGYPLAEQTMPLKIHLPEATPITGRILNSNGMPMAGAEVLPIHIQTVTRPTKKPAAERDNADSASETGWGWLKLSDAARRSGDLWSFWPQPVTTDADGRFTLPGNDNCGQALLQITAEGFGPHGVTVIDTAAVAEWNANHTLHVGQSPPLANNFTLVLEPPRTMEGTINDRETGLPVAGVEIIMLSSRDAGDIWSLQVARATSDEQGRYRLLAPATGHDQYFRIYPPLGYAPRGSRPYLEREFTDLFGNDRVYRNDVRLTPARIVRGRVIDADSRAPVRAAAVEYSVGRANPNRIEGDFALDEPVLTDADGAFQITALPGMGMISVDTRSDEHIRAMVHREMSGGLDANPHAFAAIDVAATGEPPPLELVVHRGTDLVIEPVDPDGKPIAVVAIAYREAGVPATHGLRSRHLRETPLRLPGCAPGKTYRLLIGTPNCKLGAVADVLCDPAKQPVKISLQPTGALRGKLVYADGTPASDINTFLHFHDGSSQKIEISQAQNLPFYNNVLTFKEGSGGTTDASGEFEIRGLVPGVYVYLSVNYEFASGENCEPAGTIEAGKTLDMGQLVVKP